MSTDRNVMYTKYGDDTKSKAIHKRIVNSHIVES